jgi:hypothetical protein
MSASAAWRLKGKGNMAPSYKRAVEWLALNDETAETDEEIVAMLVTTCLVADLWAKEPLDVAKAVLRYRAREERESRN